MSKKKKVFVGLSGGVDSSVSAALLQEAGYDVTGVFIKVWEAPFLPCTWREERRDAQRAAAHLGIPLVTVDLSEIYKKHVIDTFVAAYVRGETPNPDVLCNKEVKFGAFYDFAKREGADGIATGHYAQKQLVRTGGDGFAGTHRLMRAEDSEKDQTYFLWAIRQEVLRETLFPIGGLVKEEVRQIARRKGLPNAQKKDSQGICFLGDVQMAEFLKQFVTVEPGNIEDEAGNIIGTHEGAILYTIGERHGLTIRTKDAESRPWFVVGKDMMRNVIVASQRHATGSGTNKHFATAVETQSWHMISGANAEDILGAGGLSVSLRYRQDPVPVTWKKDSSSQIVLTQPVEGVARGQSAVLYRGGECLGGGIITQVISGA